MPMSDKNEIIAGVAKYHHGRGETVSFEELGKGLNDLGVQTDYGTPYSEDGGRGLANLVRGTWQRLDRDGREEDASAVARVFVNKNGEYAYK